MFVYERFASCSQAEVKSGYERREKWLGEYDRLMADGVMEDYPQLTATLHTLASGRRHVIKVLKRYERLMKKHKLAHVRDLESVDEPVEKREQHHD